MVRSLPVTSRMQINSLQHKTENVIHHSKATKQDLYTDNNKTAATLQVIKTKSNLRSEETKHEAKVVSQLLRNFAVQKLPVKSNLSKSKTDAPIRATYVLNDTITKKILCVNQPYSLVENIAQNSGADANGFTTSRVPAKNPPHIIAENNRDNKSKLILASKIIDLTIEKSLTRGTYAATPPTHKSQIKPQIENIPNQSITTQTKVIQQETKKQNTSEIKGNKRGNVSSPKSHQDSLVSVESLGSPPHWGSPRFVKKYCLKQTCDKHQNLNEAKFDDLVKPGDTFASPEEFLDYTNARGSKWMYYYKKFTADNRLESKLKRVIYTCCFKKQASTYKSKGLRKRKEYKTNCPCLLRMHQLPNGLYSVVYVCNHHDHELSPEVLAKLPSRFKFISSLTYSEFKEEILDLVSLDLDNAIIYKYMEDKIGLKLRNSMIYNQIVKLKSNNDNMHRKFTPEKLKALLLKIKELNEKYGPKIKTDDKEEHQDESKPTAYEPFTLYKGLLEVEKRKKALELVALENSKKPKRIRNRKKRPAPPPTEECNDTEKERKKSRLEATLETISDDAEVLESVKNLQKSTGDDINFSPWYTQYDNDEFLSGDHNCEELPPSVKVYATTDTHDGTNIGDSSDGEDYNNKEVVQTDEINNTIFKELDTVVGTEIEVESNDYSNSKNSQQEIIDRCRFGDQMIDTALREHKPTSSTNKHKKDTKVFIAKTNNPVRLEKTTQQNIHRVTKQVKFGKNGQDRLVNVRKEANNYGSISDDGSSEMEFTTKFGFELDCQYSKDQSDEKSSTGHVTHAIPNQKDDLIGIFKESSHINPANNSLTQKEIHQSAFVRENRGNVEKPEVYPIIMPTRTVNASKNEVKVIEFLDKSLQEDYTPSSEKYVVPNNIVRNFKDKDSNSKILNVRSHKKPTFSNRIGKSVIKHRTGNTDTNGNKPITSRVARKQIKELCRQEVMKMMNEVKRADKMIQVDLIEDVPRDIEMEKKRLNDINQRVQPYIEKTTDVIINRHNIDFYIVEPGVSKNIEYLSKTMSMPIMTLLKNIYSGKAILRHVKNRMLSNSDNVSAFMFEYIPDNQPLIPAFKLDNRLKQYKHMCSQYSNTCFRLTNAVQKMRREIDVLKMRLKNKTEYKIIEI